MSKVSPSVSCPFCGIGHIVRSEGLHPKGNASLFKPMSALQCDKCHKRVLVKYKE